jgi:RimJ/RimL family protein N-acetyltransferase
MLILPHASPDVPVIETDRLHLRAHRVEDFSHFAEMWRDERVTRHTTGRALTEEEAWSRFLRGLGHWSMLGFGYWAVEEKSSGAYGGEMGFADLRREIQPPLDGLAEMGWIFQSKMHGKGYATEAARATLAWGRSRFGEEPPVCIISPENTASIRLAEKCGFREFQRTKYRDHPVILFRNESW